MMTLLFGIKDVIHSVSKTRTQLLLGKLSYPFTFCANRVKVAAKILEQTLRPENFKSAAMATVAAGYPPKPNQL